MVVCVPVTPTGEVDPRWGRADRVAVVQTAGGDIVDWTVHDVGWGGLHDTGTEGTHHARMVRFLREQRVDTVVADHMGGAMAHTLERMGVRVFLGATGAARDVVAALGDERG